MGILLRWHLLEFAGVNISLKRWTWLYGITLTGRGSG
jgi:hypothetical protein